MKAYLLALIVTLPTAAHAADYSAERSACLPSLRRLCPNTPRGDLMAIANCLTANKTKLDQRCREALAPYGF